MPLTKLFLRWIWIFVFITFAYGNRKLRFQWSVNTWLSLWLPASCGDYLPERSRNRSVKVINSSLFDWWRDFRQPDISASCFVLCNMLIRWRCLHDPHSLQRHLRTQICLKQPHFGEAEVELYELDEVPGLQYRFECLVERTMQAACTLGHQWGNSKLNDSLPCWMIFGWSARHWVRNITLW